MTVKVVRPTVSDFRHQIASLEREIGMLRRSHQAKDEGIEKLRAEIKQRTDTQIAQGELLSKQIARIVSLENQLEGAKRSASLYSAAHSREHDRSAALSDALIDSNRARLKAENDLSFERYSKLTYKEPE